MVRCASVCNCVLRQFCYLQRRCQAPSMIAKRQSVENIDPPPKSKRRAAANRKSCKEDKEEEQKPALPRSPFGNLGNLTKTTLTSDPSSSCHVNYFF